jgi:hypothetical protein
MSLSDDNAVQAGVDRRAAAVEMLLPPRPAWRTAVDQELVPAQIRVVAGPALRTGPPGSRRLGLLFVASAVIVVGLAYGLVGGGGVHLPTPSAIVPTSSVPVTPEPTEVGLLRPMVEPRLAIPVRPTTAWTVVEDGVPYLNLAYFLDAVGSGGYDVGVAVFEPKGVYDPVVETKRLPLPPDLIDWIRVHPDLEASAPVDLSVAGLPATEIDVTVTYQSGGPKGQTAQFIDDGIGSWNLEFPSKKRIVLVHLPDRPLLIVFGSRPEFFDAAIGQFDKLLDAITFAGAAAPP